MSASKVYAAIAAVMADLSKDGIGKTKRNQQQGYNFRGIDDVYNELSPILAKHKLCILPRVLTRDVTERQTKSGGALFNVAVEVEFDFVSAEDGSKHTIKTYGEAMDSADKATNKAMSAAYKYAAMQAFCIPTEGDNDADAHAHEVAPSDRKRTPERRENDNPFDGDPDAAIAYTESCLGIIDTFQTEQEGRDWWNGQAAKRRDVQVGQAQISIMLDRMKARFEALRAGASQLEAAE